eukprot:g33428.t1
MLMLWSHIVPKGAQEVHDSPSKYPSGAVRFAVEGRTLQADKFLLAARSEYFERMLRTGMSEGAAFEVPIPRASAPAFEAVLRFIYSAGQAGQADGPFCGRLPLMKINVARVAPLYAFRVVLLERKIYMSCCASAGSCEDLLKTGFKSHRDLRESIGLLQDLLQVIDLSLEFLLAFGDEPFTSQVFYSNVPIFHPSGSDSSWTIPWPSVYHIRALLQGLLDTEAETPSWQQKKGDQGEKLILSTVCVLVFDCENTAVAKTNVLSIARNAQALAAQRLRPSGSYCYLTKALQRLHAAVDGSVGRAEVVQSKTEFMEVEEIDLREVVGFVPLRDRLDLIKMDRTGCRKRSGAVSGLLPVGGTGSSRQPRSGRQALFEEADPLEVLHLSTAQDNALITFGSVVSVRSKVPTLVKACVERTDRQLRDVVGSESFKELCRSEVAVQELLLSFDEPLAKRRRMLSGARTD